MYSCWLCLHALSICFIFSIITKQLTQNVCIENILHDHFLMLEFIVADKYVYWCMQSTVRLHNILNRYSMYSCCPIKRLLYVMAIYCIVMWHALYNSCVQDTHIKENKTYTDVIRSHGHLSFPSLHNYCINELSLFDGQRIIHQFTVWECSHYSVFQWSFWRRSDNC